MKLEITVLALLKDNYGFLLRDNENDLTAVVDPSDSDQVIAYLEAKGCDLDFVFNTHHHWDHTGGNQGLKARYGCKIVGPEYDRGRIPDLDHGLKDGDVFQFGDHKADILYIPGHTSGHIAYWFAESAAVFTGDTLFSLGCGRLFEGTPQQMRDSLHRLASLPEETAVFCGHEYTEENARFALTLASTNPQLAERVKEVRILRSAKKPTVPSTIRSEIACNPFLATDSVESFARLRTAKDLL